MTTVRRAWARLISFFRKDALDRELDEELTAHIDMATADNIRRGMSAPDARRIALARLGGIEPSKQLHRESRGLPSFDALFQDLRYAVRALWRSPGVTLTAIATLALGIGVNATVFTLTNAVLFKGFPLVERNDRLLYVTSRSYGCCASYPDFEDWRAQARSFEGMAVVHGIGITLSDDSSFSERYSATEISADTFTLVGQTPIIGRDFTVADEIPGAPPVAILRYDFWENRYGKDPGVVGRTVRLNGRPTTVIGVMPRGFSFPQNQELWIPLVRTADVQKREARNLWMAFGRLAEDVTVASARAEMAAIGSRLAAAYPRTNQGQPPIVQTFDEFFVGPNARTIYAALWVAVGFVLLIACANLANLMLARAIARSREMSLRIALGAGRWRIVRQLLVESVMLSAIGGACAWWIVKWGVRTYELADRSWRVLDYTMDYRVFGYMVAISLGTGVLFGLAPALRLSKLDVNATSKDGSRGATSGGRGRRLSSLLVVGEMALAVVLLAGAGVMIRSFLTIYTADLGVKADNILAVQLALPDARYARPEAKVAFLDRLTARLAAIPGVESVALANNLPAARALAIPYEMEGAAPVDEQRRPTLSAMIVGPGYFQTLGAQLYAGREFNDFDGASEVPAVIVNERFASQYWSGEDPLGKRLRLFDKDASAAWLTVIGVVSDIVQNDPTRQEFDPLIYVPYEQSPQQNMFVFARTRVPPGSLAAAFRREVDAIDSDLPIPVLMPLAERLHRASAFKRNSAVLFLVFASVALLLASVGLYAVIAHSVSHRTQEIGVRMAMGATARDVIALVLGQGAIPVGVGLAVGLAGAFAITSGLRSVLVQVSPADPIAFTVALLVMMVAALLGCMIPARRAMRVDPVVALRHE